MEDELKCSYCNDFYCNPVQLPCFHSLCYACALQLQEKFSSSTNKTTKTSNNNNKTNDISVISNAIANAAKSATLMAFSQSITPQSSSSVSPSSSVNMDQMCRTLSINDLGSSIVSDLDKLSVFSETDSGVALSTNKSSNSSGCNSNNCSRPCSYISHQYSPDSNYLNLSINSQNKFKSKTNGSSTPLQQSLPSPPPLPLFATSPLYSTFLPCPQCNRMIYMDETGVDSLTKNTCLENIVERYTESKKLTIKCQMCPAPTDKDAVFMCEQCEIYYCEQCREACHPMRGPLQKHVLVAPKFGRDLLRKKNRSKESKCSDHLDENVNSYCLLCKCACCAQCVSDSAHINHQMQAINTYCKSQKAELSQILQSLSEKAKSATEFVTKLKSLPEIIEDNSKQLKTILVSEIDQMINLLECKKKELVDFIDIEKSSKIKASKEQISFLSTKIQKTTGLLQFCVETLKEQDPSSFLQISEHMINRTNDIDNKFPQDLQPKIDLDFDFMLNSDAIYKEIKKLNYKQVKVPNPPSFIAEECFNNSNDTLMILSWQQTNGAKNNVQGYVLELDDGTNEGQFKEVYYGAETICQINGLSPNSIYNARVKAFNQAGCSDYSQIISISSSPTLWFSLNSKTSHPDALFSNNFMSASCMSFEDRVILGSIGFSKGVHYWEITVQRYDNQPDPCFGVARYDVAKDHMLGKDNKSWCMYIDTKRSWFMHNGKHINRIDSGIQQGCVIGVLLDLNNYTLSYFVNDEPHGGAAFTKLPKGVYYPAFSLNKNVQITLNSGLEPPPCLDNSDLE